MKKRRDQERSPVRIGWKEAVDFPEWGVASLVAKSDTGARTSAVDVASIRDTGDGFVEFDLILDRKDRSHVHHIRARISSRGRVRSSNGEVQERFRVVTLLRVGDVEKLVEFSLVGRQRMICRVLLGRSALSPEFVVDAGEKYLVSRRRRARVKKGRKRMKQGEGKSGKEKSSK